MGCGGEPLCPRVGVSISLCAPVCRTAVPLNPRRTLRGPGPRVSSQLCAPRAEPGSQ